MISLKDYLLSGLIIVLLTTIGISRWELYSVTKDFNQYKEDQNDLIQKATTEKARIEKEQNDKYKLAEAGYSGALSVLNDRLSKSKTVSWNGCVPVASAISANSTMPSEAIYTVSPTIRLAATSGICSQDFYNKAMREHLQCQRLIDLVKQDVLQPSAQ